MSRNAGSPATGRLVARWYLRLARRHLGAGPYLHIGSGGGDLLRRLAAHGSASGYEPCAAAAAATRAAAPRVPRAHHV